MVDLKKNVKIRNSFGYKNVISIENDTVETEIVYAL